MTTRSSSSSVKGGALLGVESGSFWSAAVTCAKFVMLPSAFTVAVMSSEVVLPTFRLPIVQTPDPGTYAPPLWLT